MEDIVLEYFKIIVDSAFVFQLLCVAIFTVVVMDFKADKLHDILKALAKVLFLVLAFGGINLFMWYLTHYCKYFTGIGSWFSFLGGIALFAAIFCKYQTNTRIVMASAVFSITIVVIELGSTGGAVLETYIQGFDSLYTKIGADLLLLVGAWVFKCHPVSDYFVSTHTVKLNLIYGVLSAVAVIIYDLFLIHIFGNSGGSDIKLLMTILLTFWYGANMASYLMTYDISKNQTNMLEMQTVVQVNKSAAQLLTISEYNLSELRKISHDINNQYSYMNLLLQKGEYEELKSYFYELQGNLSINVLPIVDCGNRVLNSILNMENTKAKEAGIKLEFKIAVPHELPFSELDLCNLLTNVIDNAIEACKAERIENPVVNIAMYLNGDYLFASIINPTKLEKSFLDKPVVTSKEDKLQHGKGMSIVRQIIGKYNGHSNLKIEDGIFHMEFLLDMYSAKLGESDERQVKNSCL